MHVVKRRYAPIRWWLCTKQRPIARLFQTEDDFPWVYFQLAAYPSFARYAALFALEWMLCMTPDDHVQATLLCSIANKLQDYIRRNTYVLYGQPGNFSLWRGYYAHCDGQTIWFKYGTHTPLQA